MESDDKELSVDDAVIMLDKEIHGYLDVGVINRIVKYNSKGMRKPYPYHVDYMQHGSLTTCVFSRDKLRYIDADDVEDYLILRNL